MSDQGESAQRFDASTGDVQEQQATEGSNNDLFRPPAPRVARAPRENAPIYDPAESAPPAAPRPLSGASDGYGLDAPDTTDPAPVQEQPVWESAAFDAAFDAAFGTDPDRPAEAAPASPAQP